ncbi:MAG: right-handed parallel beta-helix repeat-containing protein, partial [Chitinophagaceae bacterium]|nr:right-handed parallel beta-helix repeat-containing protein [Chitinophagaceae bacterium]
MKTLLTVLLSVLFVFYLNPAIAKTYYFSAISGDDSRTSAQAQNPSTPWKTLNKLNSFFSSLQPGDFVLFKRGETFYGSITVNKSGTASEPITISEYGTGSRPVITSLVTLTGWKANSIYRGVYESAANSAFDAKINMVLLNGTQEPIGRYPNSDLPNKGYLTFESHVGKTSITDKQLSASPNWTGADVIIRTSRWTLDRGLITSHSGTKISYSAPESYTPKDDYGYFIQNHIKTLDQLGEWYYNPSTKKISMYFGSKSPSSYTVQAASIDNLISAADKDYIVFDNITLKGANQYGVYISKNGSNITIKNCDVLFSGRDGVNVSSHTNFILENSNILNSNNDGVNIGSGNTKPIVRNNIIKNSYTIAGMGQSGNGNGAGVRNAAGGLVEYNQIINSGYLGVQLGGDYAIIKNNLIDSFCFVKDDGAGVYTSNGENAYSTGRKITGNIILNAIGAAAGTNSSGFSAEGIYMDDNI